MFCKTILNYRDTVKSIIVPDDNLLRNSKALTLTMLRLLLSKAHKAKIFENHLNPVMLVFIGKLLLSAFGWVPIC